MIEVYNIIEELRQNNSSNYKKEVLLKHSSNLKFRTFLLYTYNPRYNYYMTKLPDSELSRHYIEKLDSVSFFLILERLRKREVTGNAAKALFVDHLSLCGDELWHLYDLIISRDIKAGVGIKLINETMDNLIPEVPYMRCSKFDEKTINSFPDSETDLSYLVQKKADGVFSYIIHEDGETKLLTRNGTEWFSKSLSEDLKDITSDFILVGEALVKKGGKELDRKTGNGLINSLIKREQTLASLEGKQTKQYAKAVELDEIDKNLYFEVWDVITPEEFNQGYSPLEYSKRFESLKYITYNFERVDIVKTEYVKTVKEAQKIANRYMEEGFEGAILKHPDAIFENKTSKLQVKLKAVLDADLYCVAVEEGKGKYKGLIGALVLESSCGKLRVNVGTGLTDYDRKKNPLEYIGEIIAVNYNEAINKKGSDTWSLFLPVFQEIRTDKDVADTLERILEGAKNAKC